MASNVNSNRIFYYDFLRAFAIFCVISCHVFSMYVVNSHHFGTKFWFFSLFLNTLRDVGVPIFIMISGALLLNKQESFFKFAKKRVIRVLIPYLFWVGIFILFAYICNYYGYDFFIFSNIENLVFNVLSVNPTQTAVYFWFVPMILSVYVIIFIINKCNKYWDKTLNISLILSIILIILFTFNNSIYSDKTRYLYVVYAIFGYFLSTVNFEDNKLYKISKNKLTLLLFIFSFVFYCIFVLIDASMSINMKYFNKLSQFHFLNVILVSLIFLFFRYFFENEGRLFILIKTSIFNKIILSISLCSYGIYLSHILVKYIILEFLLNPIKGYMGISMFCVLTLILTLILSWILIWVMDKIPVLSKFSGCS